MCVSVVGLAVWLLLCSPVCAVVLLCRCGRRRCCCCCWSANCPSCLRLGRRCPRRRRRRRPLCSATLSATGRPLCAHSASGAAATADMVVVPPPRPALSASALAGCLPLAERSTVAIVVVVGRAIDCAFPAGRRHLWPPFGREMRATWPRNRSETRTNAHACNFGTVLANCCSRSRLGLSSGCSRPVGVGGHRPSLANTHEKVGWKYQEVGPLGIRCHLFRAAHSPKS